MQTDIERILATLISFDTVADRENMALMRHVTACLDSRGIPWQGDGEPGAGRMNLLARIGPDAPGGIVLAGHTDVVPTKGQRWTSNPFELRKANGRLHGRGTTDMKGFLAAVLAAASRWRDLPLRRPLYLLLTYDEEIGCTGVAEAVRGLVRTLACPAGVIVGEPTDMRIMTEHKGIVTLCTSISGKAAHSSGPARGINSVSAAADVICEIEALNALDIAPGAAMGFDPAYTSVCVTRIEGGTALNIIPDACRVWWDCRTLPGMTSAMILDAFEARLAALRQSRGSLNFRGSGIATQVLFDGAGLAATPQNLGFAAMVETISGAGPMDGGAFFTEAGFYAQAGLPTVVFGPGSIAQAHTADEFIEAESLAAYGRFLERLGAWACSTDDTLVQTVPSPAVM